MSSRQTKYFAAIIVVVLGWFFESATTLLLKPSGPYTEYDYIMFYVNATQFRNALFIISAVILFKVGGSLLVFLLMGFNLSAVLLNIMYIDPSNYAVISPWRVAYFAPAYRMAELTIITWAAWNVRDQILNYAGHFCYRCRVMVGRGRLFYKGPRA